MASVLLKSLQFTRILNRMSFTSSKLYYLNSSRVIRSFEHSRNNKACYATAAHKQLPVDELLVNDNKSSSSSKSTNPVDDALSKIDLMVKKSGRVLMKHVTDAFSMITSADMTTSTHGLYLLRSCKFCCDEPPSKRVELMNQIWNRYQELGIQFDVNHYNALLDIHISNGVAFNPVEILNSMEESSIEPNRVTYMLVMKKYCEDGNINGASEILEHMKEKGLPANEDVFNNLIQGHLKNKDFSGAKEMLDVMKASNLNPTADTYGILACGYAASGNKDEMMSYLRMAERESNLQNCLKVIDALASSGNQQHINDVLSLMMQIKINEINSQEVLNCAIELIHKGFFDVAFQMLAICTPHYEHSFHIFIKQSIKAGKPISDIMDYCSKIIDGGHSDMVFLTALRTAVEYGKFEYLVPIFKKIESSGRNIRPSSFWTLLSTFKDEKDQRGIWIILKQMFELGIPVDFTTYHDVIFPLLENLHPSTVISQVEQTGQCKETAADALFLYCCNTGKIDYAHHLTEMCHVYVSEQLNVEGFLNLYGNLNKDSVDKYLKVLKYMFKDESYILQHDDFRGKLLAELISSKPRLLEILLRHCKDLKFSKQVLQSCDRILSWKGINGKIALQRLHDVSSGRDILFKEDLTVEEENKELQYLQSQGISCKTFLDKRINYHIKTKNLQRLSELLSIFDELNLPYSPLLLSNLAALYCAASDVEKATLTYNKLKTEFSTFKLDLSKALEYVTLLVKYCKLDESIEVMKSITEPFIYGDKDSVMRKFSNLSLAVANTNNAEFAKTMQNLLLPLSNEFKTKKAILHSVVQLHLQRNDFNAAYEEFKNSIKNHHTPFALNLFLRKCISVGEKDILQKVIDLTISCKGESYALLELALAFIENRNYDKASAVIKSLGTGAHPKDVEDLCVRLMNHRKLGDLENFISLTSPLNLSNREHLYCLAIKGYAAKADYDKATELYNEMIKEMGEPSQKTVNFMRELFASNNQPIPLNVMSKAVSEVNPTPHEATKDFIAQLEAGNVNAALKELGELKKGYIRTLSLKNLTDLLDLCLQENCVNDLSTNVQAMSYIIDNVKDVFRPILQKYSEAGDVEKFISIARFFPDFSLISVGFNSYFCQAFISSGKLEDLLLQLEQRVDKKNKMFSYAAFEELAKCPEYENRIFDLAVKYYDSKFVLPMSVLWALHFSKENFDMADKIFKNFTITIDKADNIILRAIKQNQDVNLAKKYIDAVKFLNVRPRIKERAYGAALDVLVLKGMYDEAVDLVLNSEQLGLQLTKYYMSTLITLKNILEKENKPVPFHLPSDASSESSSE